MKKTKLMTLLTVTLVAANMALPSAVKADPPTYRMCYYHEWSGCTPVCEMVTWQAWPTCAYAMNFCEPYPGECGG